LLLRDAELDGGIRTDVLVGGGLVVRVEPGLGRGAGVEEIACGGAAVIPGLCDHHLHLRALAAWERSVRCGPPEVTGPAALGAALRGAEPDATGWVRGVGYAGDLDAAALDGLRPDVPVRVQHRSGALWMLNSAAIAATGLDTAGHPGVERDGRGRATGRVWRADGWLRARLPPAPPEDLAPLGRRLARLGITAVTDATPDLPDASLGLLREAVRDGALPQRVHLLGGPDGLDEPRLTSGPYKIVIADSALPALDELTEEVAHVHARGRAVAVHCVSYEAIVLLLAALRAVGSRPGDRVEHAALVPEALIAELRRLGLAVVTQPGFLAHRGGGFLREIPARDHADLYRCASLRAAGIPLALSSDAPYGPLDPWRVIQAAADRRTEDGRVAGPGERLSPEQALTGYLATAGDPGGPPRRIVHGAPADLLVLDGPLREVLARPGHNPVRFTVIEGRIVG
jgi:predicted amidohydrolase YtcJ